MDSKDTLRKLHDRWKNIRKTSAFKDVLLYFVFVGIAALFWVILSLNNNMEHNINVNVRIYNVPDSVTFLTNPPAQFHLNVRDKGSNLLRNGLVKPSTMNVNFMEYASGGVFRFTSNDLYSHLRTMFGQNAQISSVSLDSICFPYTSNPGKRVPVVVSYDITAGSGKILASAPSAEPKWVLAYSNSSVLDTLSRVFTAKVVRRNVTDSEEVEVRLMPVGGVKVVPDKVKVSIPVDALVANSSHVPLKVKNMPSGESALLYPDKVEISYFIPMAHYSSGEVPVSAYVDYEEMKNEVSGRIPVHLGTYPPYCINVTLKTDSVDATLIR